MLFASDVILAGAEEREPIYSDEINDGIAHAAKVSHRLT